MKFVFVKVIPHVQFESDRKLSASRSETTRVATFFCSQYLLNYKLQDRKSLILCNVFCSKIFEYQQLSWTCSNASFDVMEFFHWHLLVDPNERNIFIIIIIFFWWNIYLFIPYLDIRVLKSCFFFWNYFVYIFIIF